MMSRPTSRLAAWSALLVLAIVAVYWPGRHGGFMFDDFPNIVDNLALRVESLAWDQWIAAIFSSPASAFQRPIAMATFAVNQYFTGLAPFPMKMVNLGIHAANALLVFALVRRIVAAAAPDVEPAQRERAALFVAFAWALHPLQLMGVLYIVQRMESLCHLFVFAGLLAYAIGRERQIAGRGGWALILGGIIGGTVLGLGAKESAVLLPLYAFLLEVCVFRFRMATPGQSRWLWWMYIAGLFAPAILGLGWLWPRVAGAYAIREFTVAERLLTEARVMIDYVQWTLLPDPKDLGLYHDDYTLSRGLLQPMSTLWSLLALVAMTAVGLWLRTRRPLVALGIAWFLAAHLLTATIIPLELVYEHRNYFASLGLLLVLGDLLFLGRRTALAPMLGFIAVALVLCFGAITMLRASEWSDPFTFARTEAAKRPESPRATYGLAQQLVIATRYDPRSALLEETWRALAVARAVPNGGILPQSAALLLQAHVLPAQDPKVWDEMVERLRAHPIGAQEISAIGSLVKCARSHECRFPDDRMDAVFDAALSHRRHADIVTIQGDYLLNVRNEHQRALDLWREAVALDPGTAQYRINLVKLLITLGLDAEARQQIAALRALGHVGQNEAAAQDLERRMDAWHARRASSGPT